MFRRKKKRIILVCLELNGVVNAGRDELSKLEQYYSSLEKELSELLNEDVVIKLLPECKYVHKIQ